MAILFLENNMRIDNVFKGDIHSSNKKIKEGTINVEVSKEDAKILIERGQACEHNSVLDVSTDAIPKVKNKNNEQ